MPTFTTGSIVVLASLLWAPFLSSQLIAQTVNSVKNGDFAGGKTTGWTFAGFSVSPKVMPFDTTGVGASLGFSNRPGCKTAPCNTEYTMEQKVFVVANGLVAGAAKPCAAHQMRH